METLTQEQIKPVLIYELEQGINELNALAAANVMLLQQVHQQAPELKSEELILAAAANPKKFVMDKFFSTNKEAERMATFSKLEFHIGSDLEALERLLTGVTARTFKFTMWDRRSKTFEIDREDLELAYKRYRRYAVSEQEQQRFAFAKNYCDYLNSFCGQSSIKKFVGEIMTYEFGKGYVPNINFVKESYRY